MATDLEWAWLAGLIDGEGSFVTSRVTKDRGRDVNWIKYRISVQMVDQKAIKRCEEITGLGKARQVGKTKTGKDIWSWKVEGRSAAVIAQMLLPYLTTKEEQAKLLIDLAQTMNQYGDSRAVSNEILERRNELCNKIALLNH